MNFLKGIGRFFKNFFVKLYKNTIGPVVTLCAHSFENRLVDSDKKAMKQVALWLILLAVLAFFPGQKFLVSLVSSFALFDILGMIAQTFFDLAKLYEEEELSQGEQHAPA